MRPDQKAEYRDFVASRQHHLRRFAYLSCGDWHRAEDIVQTAFIKLYTAWTRVSGESLDAYTRRIIVNTIIDDSRRGWFRRERPTDMVMDRPNGDTDPTDRLTVLEALEKLPPRRRMTLVLRYWEDMSVDQTAQIMRCSVNTVKSQTARAIQSLRVSVVDSTLETPQGAVI